MKETFKFIEEKNSLRAKLQFVSTANVDPSDIAILLLSAIVYKDNNYNNA